MNFAITPEQLRARRCPRVRAAAALTALLAMAALTLASAPVQAQTPPPDTPSSVTVTRADGSLTASWPAAANATGYHITYSSDGGGSWSLGAYDHAGTSITISSVTNSDTYIVAVRALNSSGGSGWRNSAPAGPFAQTPPPDTPSSVTVTRADGSLTASWPAAANATGYHITYSSDGGGSWSLGAYDHAGTSITISSVTNSDTYIVAVRALNSSGGSGWRNSAPAGPFAQTPPPDTPSSVTVTRADGSLTASWPAAANATGYHITYSSDGGGSWSLGAYDHAGTSITISSVTNSDTYIVAVRALNSSGGSGWRNSAPAGPFVPPPPTSTTLPPEAPDAPDAPTLTAGVAQLAVTWDAPADNGAAITGYHVIYRRGSTEECIKNWIETRGDWPEEWPRWWCGSPHQWYEVPHDGTGTSATVTGLDHRYWYTVIVTASNSVGWSDWSEESAAKPDAAPPGKPDAPTVEAEKGEFGVWLRVDYKAVPWTGARVHTWGFRYRDKTTTTWQYETRNATVYTDASITNVVGSTTYEVQVRAANAKGWGPWSDSGEATTAPFG